MIQIKLLALFSANSGYAPYFFVVLWKARVTADAIGHTPTNNFLVVQHAEAEAFLQKLALNSFLVLQFSQIFFRHPRFNTRKRHRNTSRPLTVAISKSSMLIPSYLSRNLLLSRSFRFSGKTLQHLY
jgi:hypothetical protein